MDLFRRFNISVLEIQVQIGYPLKSSFSKKFEKLINNDILPSLAAKKQFVAVKALVSTWNTIATPIMTET